MCIFCGSKSHLTHVSRIPDLSRRSFVSNAAAFGGLYAGAKILGSSEVLAQTRSADILIENAKVVTLDPKTPNADAIAIAGDKVVGVGSRRELSGMVTSATKVIDAGKRTVVPGLNDSHTHFIRGGLNYSLEVRWDGVPSLSDALAMLKAQAVRTPAPHWVQVVKA